MRDLKAKVVASRAASYHRAAIACGGASAIVVALLALGPASLSRPMRLLGIQVMAPDFVLFVLALLWLAVAVGCRHHAATLGVVARPVPREVDGILGGEARRSST